MARNFPFSCSPSVLICSESEFLFVGNVASLEERSKCEGFFHFQMVSLQRTQSRNCQLSQLLRDNLDPAEQAILQMPDRRVTSSQNVHKCKCLRKKQISFTVPKIQSIISAVSKTWKSKIKLNTGDPWATGELGTAGIADCIWITPSQPSSTVYN